MTYAGIIERVTFGPDFTRGEHLECLLKGFGRPREAPGARFFVPFDEAVDLGVEVEEDVLTVCAGAERIAAGADDAGFGRARSASSAGSIRRCTGSASQAVYEGLVARVHSSSVTGTTAAEEKLGRT